MQNKRNLFTIGRLNKLFSNFNPRKLVAILKKEYSLTYNQDVGLWEGYSLEKHSVMVLYQFEKYYSEKKLPGNFDKNVFRLILALHDIGKPDAIKKKNKHLQHKLGQVIVNDFFTQLGLNKNIKKVAVAIIGDDPIGEYLTSLISVEQAAKLIKKMAKKSDLRLKDFFKLLIIFYMVDAASYTKDAGGYPALDGMFVVDKRRKKINFASHVQERINFLKKKLY